MKTSTTTMILEGRVIRGNTLRINEFQRFEPLSMGRLPDGEPLEDNNVPTLRPPAATKAITRGPGPSAQQR